jgi:hypothetical protein
MIQKNEVLTREDNCISVISTKRATTRRAHRTIAERKIPVNTIEQTCIFQVREEICAIRTTPRIVNTLVKIMKWLSHLGSGKIDDSCLESRQNMHYNITIKRIGL